MRSPWRGLIPWLDRIDRLAGLKKRIRLFESRWRRFVYSWHQSIDPLTSKLPVSYATHDLNNEPSVHLVNRVIMVEGGAPWRPKSLH